MPVLSGIHVIFREQNSFSPILYKLDLPKVIGGFCCGVPLRFAAT